jgi:hypothetical protein
VLLGALAIVSITCIRADAPKARGVTPPRQSPVANIAKFGPSPATLKRRDTRVTSLT